MRRCESTATVTELCCLDSDSHPVYPKKARGERCQAEYVVRCMLVTLVAGGDSGGGQVSIIAQATALEHGCVTECIGETMH